MSRARNRKRISALGAVPLRRAEPLKLALFLFLLRQPLLFPCMSLLLLRPRQPFPRPHLLLAGVAGNQAPAQGANDQEAQRQAMEAQLRMQLQNLLRAPIDPVELDKRLVIDGMRRVKDLREGEYEDWILKVSDALLQAGMHAMYNITGVQRDELAEEADVRACSLYPVWALNTAWSAIRSSLPAHGPAQAKTLSMCRVQ